MNRKVLVFYFVLICNYCFSQESLFKVIDYINSNEYLNHFDVPFEDSNIIAFGEDLSVLFDDKNVNISSKKNGNSFKIVKNVNSNLYLKINEKHYGKIYDYNVFKIVLFQGGDFILLEKTNNISLYVESKMDFSDKKSIKILGVNNIYGIDYSFVPKNVLSLYNNQVLFTSFFKYKKDFVEEKMIINNPSTDKRCDVLNENLKLVFFKFQINDGSLVCSISRVTYNKTKIQKENLFWFLRYFIEVNHYSDDVFKYE